MKKQNIFTFLKLFFAPLLVIALGLVLIINPDSASAVISKIIGWIIILTGIGFGVSAIWSERGRIPKGIAAVVLAMVGGWLVKNPLALAAWFGRIIGILLIFDGIEDISQLRKHGMTFRMPLIITVVGIILVVMPMTTSRLVFSLCGVVVLLVGVGMLLDRIRDKKRLNAPKDDIIDAL